MADLKVTSMTSAAAGTALEDVLHIIDDPTGTPINKKVSVTDFINNLPSFIGFSNSVQDIADNAVTAISITTALTLLETTGSVATTLANGTVQGQIKIIINDTDGGTSVLTPQSRLGYLALNFADDGDSAMLMWTGSAWAIIGFADVAADIPADLIDII
jgi:hypothetical protein